MFRGSKASLAIVIGLLVAGAGYVFLVVTQSGIMPGDTAAPASVGPMEGSGQFMDLAAWPWTMFVLIATAVLGAALAFGQFKASKLTPRQEEKADAGSRDIYAEEDEDRTDLEKSNR